MQINVEISEKKNGLWNDIIDVPPSKEEEHERREALHAKADNDMESSDLNFSQERNEVDEHGYQIEQLGTFEIDRSVSDHIQAINKDESVDFSLQEFSGDEMP